MGKSLFSLLLLIALISGSASAGEIKEITFHDGSVIHGEILSLKDDIYTLKSTSLGIINVEASKVRTIKSAKNAGEEIRVLQQQMINNQDLLDIVLSLQKDPDFQVVLEDPSVMEAVNSGDIDALISNPKFIKLLSNPKILTIRDKIME